MIKVVIVDDHALMRAGICRIINESNDIRCAGEAKDYIEAINIINRTNPDIALIDISLPGRDGIELISDLRITHPSLCILVLTMHEEQSFVMRALKAGANGYITKKSVPDQLVQAIRHVYSGKLFVPDSTVEAMALRMKYKHHGTTEIDRLTGRELQVLIQLALGRNNQEIATDYNISIRTVNTHRFHILKKLGLRNNADITRFAIGHRLIEV